MEDVKSIKKEIVKDIDIFYEAAFAAVCHCADNPAGVFPKDCSCKTEKTQESIHLLLDLRKRLLNKYGGSINFDI